MDVVVVVTTRNGCHEHGSLDWVADRCPSDFFCGTCRL